MAIFDPTSGVVQCPFGCLNPHVPNALFWLALSGETVLVASEHVESVPGVKFDAETDSGVGTDPKSSQT